jgi:TolB protein
MTDPRRASVKFLALLTLAFLAAALPQQYAAQTELSKPQQQSPNGKIAFQSTQGSDGFTNDVYVMNADGKRQTRLTDDPGDDTTPIWSPQGDRIAFLSNRGGSGYEIFLMNADGSECTLLLGAERGGPLHTINFEWSPDGSKIRLISGGKLYVAQVGEGAGPAQNLTPEGAFDSAASWSPDGSRLAVISTGSGGSPDLFVVTADGVGRTQLTTTPDAESNPRWVEGGARLAYDAGQDLHVVNPDGSGGAVVTSAVGPMRGAVWSPDGTRVAFIVAENFRQNLYAANPDGSGAALLTDVEANGGNGVFWSPDGSKVAFHFHNGTATDLYVVNADGSRRADNYTKTRRADEFASSWQKVTAP